MSAIRHGTKQGYGYHRCRCAPCRRAQAKYVRQLKDRPREFHVKPPGGPWLPALHVLALVAAAYPGQRLPTLLEPLGLARRARLILSGEQAWLSLEVADRIVMHLLNPDVWHTDPVLAAIYEAA